MLLAIRVLISRFPLGVDIPVLPEFLGNELYADMLGCMRAHVNVRIGNVSVVEQYRLSNEDVAASRAGTYVLSPAHVS